MIAKNNPAEDGIFRVGVLRGSGGAGIGQN
jgi:hypothetical protein